MMMMAMIQTVSSEVNFAFTGNHAVAAIAAVRAHKMIDAMGVPADSSPDTPATRFQIPYSSVVMAYFRYVPDDTEVEDDNCKVRTPEEESTEPGGDEPGGDDTPGDDTPGDEPGDGQQD